MKKMLLGSLSFVLVAGFAASSLAQTAPAAPAPAPAAAPAGRLPTQPFSVELAAAKKMAAAAEAAAAAVNQHIAICIMDVRGDIVYFERMDGTNPIPVGSSQAKAHAVLMFGMPTSQIANAAKAGTPMTLKTPLAAYSELDIRSGGLPIMKNGKMIGSIGVGGSASETDEAFAQAGIDALGK